MDFSERSILYTRFTPRYSSRYRPLCWTTSVQSTPSKPGHLKPISTLSSCLVGILIGLFPWNFQTESFYAFLISSMRATCTTHLILPNLIILIFSEELKLWGFSWWDFVQPQVISPLLSPNILQSTQFLSTLNLCYFVSVGDQVSNQYETKGKIIFLHF